MTRQDTHLSALQNAPLLLDILAKHARQQGAATAFVFIGKDGTETTMSFAELFAASNKFGHWLSTLAAPGDRVILALDSGPDYVCSFLGALAAGIIAIPLFPPESARTHHMVRLRTVIADADPACILTERDAANDWGDLTEVPVLAAADCPDDDTSFVPTAVAADDLAFLQYTSGSTSAPKGVMVSHGNIIANTHDIMKSIALTADDVCVSWLPIYHDMGLIATVLTPIVMGMKTVNMSPKRFLMRPERWLQALSDHRGTMTGAPDFAYRLCTEVIRDKTIETLDLSHLQVAFSGSEPVRAQTLDRFAYRFAPAGLARETLLPSYGLAEATLGVSVCARGTAPTTCTLPDSDAAHVDCGIPMPTSEVRIGGPDFAFDNRSDIGEVYVSSPSVTLGYWGKPNATAQTFRTIDGQRWLRTGDLGFLSDGHIVITGRAKDLIILDGQNLFPQDIEIHVEETQPHARNGRVAAYPTQSSEGEGFGIALELTGADVNAQDLGQVTVDMAGNLAQTFGRAPTEILLINPRSLPRTSSGKLQRGQAAQISLKQPEIIVHRYDGTRTEATRPLTEMETKLATLWEGLLSKPVTDPSAHFFIQGGSSVQASRLVAMIEAQFQVSLSLGTVFAAPTLAQMATHIAEAAPASTLPVARPQGPLRLSGLSSYFWLLDGFGVGGLTHVAGGLRFSGGVDVARLAAALAQVVARQEALRLRFVPLADGGLAATARSPEEGFAGLRQMDFAAMPAQVAAARLDHFSAQDAGDALDLQDGPGWRATLVHLPGDEQVLLLTLHHIMCDGWSMGVLQADLLAALAGQLDPTPLAPSYLDVQHWQAALAEADAGSDDLGWWQDRLGHAGPPPLELPTDRPRPAQRSWRGGRVTLDIPAPLADRLRLLATAQGATLQQVLMAGWAALLHRLSGAEDLCIGLPVAGRDRAVQQQMVGLFVNTLPLPVHPDPQAGFAALLDQLRDSAGHALQHQNVALDALTRALRGDEAQAARPLFDVVHAHQPGGFAPVTLPGGQTVTPFARATGAQQFDLALETVEAASGPISTALGYDADLFLEDTATRWLQAYRDLLDAAAADPAQPLDLLPLMPPAAQAQLTAPWPDSQVQATVLVPAQIAAQDPARTAIVFAGTETSYGQLNAQANQVAQALLARGIAREDRIAICLPRGPAAIAACLGVLRAGGAFVPLDPGHPADRRAHIITDCGAALVIGEGPAERPALTSAEIAQASQTPPDLTLHPDQLAYVIYTSGSTGTPKGVAVSHGPLAMHVASTAAAYEMGPACRELHMLSLAFDGAHERWMVPFWLGGAIVLRPDTLWSGQDALDVMAAQQVTNAGFPTALLQQVAEAAQGQTPPPVQMYSFGGEAMPGAGYDLARQTLRPDLMINGYGPTECVISPMIWKGRAGDSCATPHLPIGRPVGARRAYVLDDRLRPVLPGMPGTLYLSGGLARGYLGRPGQTAAAFLPDPFGAPGDRMYCTGDRVRQRPDGVIDYLGRADRQIKLRGYRIEPGEIEARLGACEEVARAHVAKVDTDTGPLLAGWITPAQGAHPDETTLQNHLRRDLPGYMIPAQIEIINSFPQTPNGKTDTAALKLTERNSPQTTTETLTPTETKIATIWENITQQKPNKNTNFFNQNNDSIKAMQMVTRMRQAGFDISLRQFFAVQTLEGIAAHATPLAQSSVQTPTGPAALTPIQKWFLHRDDPTPDHWNQYVCVTPGTDITADQMTEALQALTQAHDVFRTAFRQGADGWRAIILPDATPVRLVTCHAADLDTYLARAQKSLSLQNGDLFRAIWSMGETPELYLIAHHMIVDGVSWRVILDDLEQHVSGQPLMRGGAPARWAAELDALAVPETQTATWAAQQAQIRDLPVDNPQGDNTAAKICHYRHAFDPAMTSAAISAGRPYKIDLQSLMLTALAQVLWTWTGERENVVALETHGRMGRLPAPDRAIGWFTAVVPVTLSAGAAADCLCKTKDTLAEAAQNASQYNNWRHATGATGPKIAFNHLGRNGETGAKLQMDMRRSGLSTGPNSPVEPEITLLSYITDDQLHIDWEYAGARITDETITRLARHFTDALANLIDHCRNARPRATPSDYPLAPLTQVALDRIDPLSRGIADLYPVTPLQAGMLFHADLNPGHGAYVNQMRMTLEGLTAAQLQAAWVSTCARHDMFRTGFAMAGAAGEPLQMLYDTAAPDIRIITGAEPDIHAAMQSDRAKGFDLTRPPLSRLTIVETGPQRLCLIWTCHHLLTDGWSLGTFLSEVLQIAQDPQATLAQALPFKTHVSALEERPFDQNYWAHQLAELESPTRLADAFTVPGAAPAERTTSLPDQLAEALTSRANALGVTLNTCFQAALALTMRRYQRDKTVCFGMTTSGRNHIATDQPAVGLYISTLPVICDLDDQPVDDWLRQIQQRSLELLDHEGDALTAIAAQAPQRGGELFDTLLAFENYPLDMALKNAPFDQPVTIKDYTLEEQTNFPLAVAVLPHDGLTLRLNSGADAFGADGLKVIETTLIQALTSLATSEYNTISDLRRALGTDLQLSDLPVAPTGTLTERFAQIVTQYPDHYALRYGETRLTYQELDHWSNALAHRIIGQTGKTSTRIGLACDRSINLVIGILAILKAGAAYVPLDPANPADRLRYIADDAELSFVVTDQHLPSEFGGIISFDGLKPCTQPPQTPPGQAAYVIYTSGSTGKPKGVEVTHTNVLHLLERTRFGFDASDIWTFFHAYSFDFSVWEIFGALLSGGELVIVPYLTSRDPQAIAALLRDTKVTVFGLTPTAFHHTLPELLRSPSSDYRLRHLRLGAEMLELSSLAPVWDHFDGLTVHHTYGPTETTVFVTHHIVTPDDMQHHKKAPLGQPTSGVALYLLDDLMQPVPDGVPGEVHIAGPAVTNGYLNRAELNAKVFPEWNGQRVYKTGDLARRGAHGRLEFIGRADQQIKLRGYRIELGEVETVLRSLPGVTDAAVIQHSADGQSDLAGYYAGQPEDDLRAALGQMLPAHMVPRWLTQVTKLPITPNGKLDRRALPRPAYEHRSGPALQTETEQKLAAMWQELLGTGEIFADDDFFARGGHSLLVTRLRTRIEQEWGQSIPLKTFFDLRQLAQIAAYLDASGQPADSFDDLTALLDELEN
ncbi:amino acid adenylation domain-containing protein [Loktanella agnita]|uniref:amino acid adenylation domain-containing protein n=1 Tax=Loktanella agnita TaxID=287097 RepID=UPI003987FB73